MARRFFQLHFYQYGIEGSLVPHAADRAVARAHRRSHALSVYLVATALNRTRPVADAILATATIFHFGLVKESPGNGPIEPQTRHFGPISPIPPVPQDHSHLRENEKL